MKNTLIYLFIIIAAFSCSKKDDRLKEFKQSQKDQKNIRTIRPIQEVKRIINTVDPTTKSTDVKILALIAKDVLSSSIASNPNDTLLYIVEGGDKSMIVSPNVKCNPIIAIFDGPDNSILHELANPSESYSGVMDFIEQAIIYNQKPDEFDVYYNTKSPLAIIEEVLPKVPVTWDQRDPFNKYVPNGCAAGCVAIAAAQALMVTRHLKYFNDIPLDYNRLIKMKNRNCKDDFPSEANTIARLIYEIGKFTKMRYGKDGSTAWTSNAIKLFTTMGNKMVVDKKPSGIRKTLRDYRYGIVIVDSGSNKSILGIQVRGWAHTYIADGYRIYSDGSDLIHINFGGGFIGNGYYLTKLTAPKFTPDSPDELPYNWNFYCLYK